MSKTGQTAEQYDQSENYRDNARLTCRQVAPARAVQNMADDVRMGLQDNPRQIPPKYFYDDTGSVLFDRICDTPEYYPTRTEEGLLETHAVDIISHSQPGHILELGSGTSRKTRHLIAASAQLERPPTYWPFDVCEPMLIEAGQGLVNDYDWLDVHALVGDYAAGLDHLPLPDDGHARLYVFLGGTLGNFYDEEAAEFLGEIAALMSPRDHLLLGVDRLKPTDVLNAAYNDAAGYTARFNRNVLHVLNRELRADFDPEHFEHRAEFNTQANRIEMYLDARTHQSIHVQDVDLKLEIEAGESILTEISRKYGEAELAQLFKTAGLTEVAHYQDAQDYYSLCLLSRSPSA